MSNDLSRRQFFRLGPLDILRGMIDRKGDSGQGRGSEPIRPPGALAKEEFLALCERCRKCSDACMHNTIRHSGPASGVGEGMPFLLPEEVPCYWCERVDCAAACPSGALQIEEGVWPKPIALAVVDNDACLNSRGTICDMCVYYCPVSVKALFMKDQLPVIDAARCVGCGLCSHYCAAPESAIQMISVEGGSP